MTTPNKSAAVNPAIASRLHGGQHWRRVVSRNVRRHYELMKESQSQPFTECLERRDTPSSFHWPIDHFSVLRGCGKMGSMPMTTPSKDFRSFQVLTMRSGCNPTPSRAESPSLLVESSNGATETVTIPFY